MGSIISKAESAMNTGPMIAERERIVDDVMNGRRILSSGSAVRTPEEAAERAVEILRAEIGGSGTPSDVVAALQDISYGIRKSGDGIYTIDISFSSVSRASLAPEKYGGIDNLAALYNNGVDHVMNQVVVDHFGQKIGSRTVIQGTHFMQSAQNSIMNMGADYNVLSCDISGEYS